MSFSKSHLALLALLSLLLFGCFWLRSRMPQNVMLANWMEIPSPVATLKAQVPHSKWGWELSIVGDPDALPDDDAVRITIVNRGEDPLKVAKVELPGEASRGARRVDYNVSSGHKQLVYEGSLSAYLTSINWLGLTSISGVWIELHLESRTNLVISGDDGLLVSIHSRGSPMP